MGKVLFCSIVMSFSFIAYAKQDINSYFYDIVFLNGLTLADEAIDQCDIEHDGLSDSRIAFCQVFEKLSGKSISLRIYKNKLYETIKVDELFYSTYSDEDFSLHEINAYTKSGESFKAVIDTGSFVSIADVEPNLFKESFSFKLVYRDKVSAGIALVDMNTDIAGIDNKIILTRDGFDSVLGVDFIGQYDQFSFYSDGIWIQPEDITCTEKCVSYDADFDGENLHFFYPLNGRIERVSFETGSPISTVPFSLEDRCIAEEIDFSELEKRGLDVGDEAKVCKKDFEFGDYTMKSSVVTQTSREIDGEPLPVMGMNMINAFDHVTVDMPAGKIYFYTPE
ncbi:hypothetical protein [Marinomonas gallaica]|uniref:hypothetical protein n=1 Tax=Marinomonas gallaica TaxID=1806667 RepID=UPI003A8E4725